MSNSRSHKEERSAGGGQGYIAAARKMREMTVDIIQSSPLLNRAADIAGAASRKWETRYKDADKRQSAKEKKTKIAAAKGSY